MTTAQIRNATTQHGQRMAAFSIGGFYATIAPAVPLLLIAHGFTKTDIIVYFAVGSIASGIANATLNARIRRSDRPPAAVAACALLACIGMVGTLFSHTAATAWVFSVLLAPMTLVYPKVVSIATAGAHRGEAVTRAVAGLRATFIGGYVAGLTAVALIQQLASATGHSVPPAVTAVGFAVCTLIAALRLTDTKDTAFADVPASPIAALPNRRRFGVAVTVLTALMAAETVRLVYLPLYVAHNGLPVAWIPFLLLVSVLVEIPALPVIGHLQQRAGTQRAMLVVCGLGLASFSWMFFARSFLGLAGSQVLFALFTAGVQTIALVYVGDLLPGGVGAASGLFTLLTQVGALAGVAAPALVPDFNAAIFLIAAGLSALAGMVVYLGRRLPDLPVSFQAIGDDVVDEQSRLLVTSS